MNNMKLRTLLLVFIFSLIVTASSQTSSKTESGIFDAELAKKVGADDYGMKNYVLVILKTGPKKVPEGKERADMFAGHFANMKRLAGEGKLALAGPLDGVDGWRGVFVLAVSDIEEAKKIVATDPVIIKGEMVAEYHKWFASAAMMLVNEAHYKVAKKSF
ncbi:MAG: YciI family protein [Pyrinomonadaceae bacterium]